MACGTPLFTHYRFERVQLMKSLFRSVCTALVVLAASHFAAHNAHAGVIEYRATGTPVGSPDGLVDAKALFSIDVGKITVTLTNLFANPISRGQNISGIRFDVSGATGSGTLSRTTDAGQVTTISNGGGYTAGVNDVLTRWQATETGSTIRLTTLSGGPPTRLIIGPDDKGSFDPSGGGLYKASNASVRNANPNILGSATFTITTPGVTLNSALSNVFFEFGTTPRSLEGTVVPPAPSTVPEPSSFALLGLGGIGFALRAYRRRQIAAV